MNNQVAWAPVAKSSFQGRIWGILCSIPRENNTWPVRMSRINRPLFWSDQSYMTCHMVIFFFSLINSTRIYLIKLKKTKKKANCKGRVSREKSGNTSSSSIENLESKSLTLHNQWTKTLTQKISCTTISTYTSIFSQAFILKPSLYCHFCSFFIFPLFVLSFLIQIYWNNTIFYAPFSPLYLLQNLIFLHWNHTNLRFWIKPIWD